MGKGSAGDASRPVGRGRPQDSGPQLHSDHYERDVRRLLQRRNRDWRV